MSRKFSITAFLLLFMAIPALLLAGMIGKPAPGFSLPSMDGRPVALADYRGKVVFIDFWASWCPPCKKEFPELNAFLKRQTDPDFVVLAINVDTRRAHAEEFVRGLASPLSDRLHVLLDPGASVIAEFNARAMPTSFIIDRLGNVRFIHFGFSESDPQAWGSEVGELLKEGVSGGGV
ncbi:MAG: TlpA family protein disulfide reductase [Thermodesulfobacteriota bacterium]